MNFPKYCVKNDCTYLTIVGTSHSFKLHTFETLIYNLWVWYQSQGKWYYCIRSCNSQAYSKTILMLAHQCLFKKFKIFLQHTRVYTRMSSKNTTMPKSNILENNLLLICMNMVGALVSPMGIITHSHRLYLIRNVVFWIFSSAIQHYQYLLQRLIYVKYFALPI